jgi:hypothetical protein
MERTDLYIQYDARADQMAAAQARRALEATTEEELLEAIAEAFAAGAEWATVEIVATLIEGGFVDGQLDLHRF